MGAGAAGRRSASCTAPRLRPTPCWSARVPRSASSPPRDSATCWRSGGRCATRCTSSRSTRRRRPFWRRDVCGTRCRSGSARPARCCKPLDEAAVADAADALVAAGAQRDRGRVPVLVPRRHARAARARDHPGAPSRRVRLAVVGGRPGVPRIRTHRRHRLRRLREAGGRPLSRQSRQRPAERLGARAAADHAVARRHFRIARRRGCARCACFCPGPRPA